MNKAAVVIHSGGMDSSLCLALAIKEFGPEQLVSLSFAYGQRHAQELDQAKKICQDWNVAHRVISLDFLQQLTSNALMDPTVAIAHSKEEPPNTLVIGRNGLMARLGAILAHSLGASSIYMGVMELEVANSGYPDCSRVYMDLVQSALRLDLGNPTFAIRTPLVKMTKEETLALADSLGLLDYLIENTISCYEGTRHPGCGSCPACLLRNLAIKNYKA